MTGDFNIRNNLWDTFYPHYSSHSNCLFEIADSFNLGLSIPTNWVTTRYSDNNQDVNLILDLMFLCFESDELDNYSIHLDWRLASDHAPLMITISIIEEHIQTKKQTIVKDSKKERIFVKELIEAIKDIDTNDLSNVDCFNKVILDFVSLMERIWIKNSKIINITKHSKSWWNVNCSRDLEKYRLTKHIKDWKQFKKTVKNTKRSFFNLKIQEISNKRQGSWELMNWINKCKLPAVEVVKYNGHTCLEIEDLWHVLHLLFNMAQNYQIDIDVLDEIPSKSPLIWVLFLEEKFISSIVKCNNSSTPGPNKLS